MDQLQQFINQYNGQKGVGNTPENKGECVGLVMVWFKEVLGLPQIWGNAMDLLKNADPSKYTIEYNTPTGAPPRGSALVFNKAFNGTFGHTGLVTRADINTFELFEQNNPLGMGCRLHTYPNYAYVVGWIIPKITTTPQPTDREVRDLYNKQIITFSNALGVNQDDPNRDKLILAAIADLQKRPQSCPPSFRDQIIKFKQLADSISV